jgi:phosphatidylglycerol:prolipoprotein diacylglycerol transferase
MFFSINFNPSKVAFEIPWLQIPIAWYGILFALGFWLSTLLFRKLHSVRPLNDLSIDEILNSLTTYMVVGIVLGARIVHMLFYEPIDLLIEDPLSLLRLREGGLASHGGIFFCVVACWLFAKHKKINFWNLSDRLWICGLVVAIFIRFGNFINQEILGTYTDMPWGVVFQSPNSVISNIVMSRHPVQMYEAFFYAALLIATYQLFVKKIDVEGKLSAICCFWIGFGRFFIEFFKEDQSFLTVYSPINMGQILSLPMIVGSMVLFIYLKRKKAQA